MKKILILGSTGKLGKVLTEMCIENNYRVCTLVRSPEKINIKNDNLIIIKGSVTDEKDLLKSLERVDIVISALGHGFRTSYPIQKNTMKILIPIMEEKKTKRLITITGAGLKTKEDSESLILNLSEKIFSLIDPYRINDAKSQQELLEKSKLDWTVVRTPIHKDSNDSKIKYVGYNQPKPWQKISRKAISKFMIDVIEKDEWVKKSPIIY